MIGMPNGSAAIDQSLFEEAIKEVIRLEKLLVQPKSLTVEALSSSPLFEKVALTPSVTTWEKALDDALHIEQRTPISKPKPEKPKPKVVTEEERLAKEREEIEKMKAKFAALEEEAEKPKPEKKPEEMKPAAPEVSSLERKRMEEEIRLMRERLSTVLKQKEIEKTVRPKTLYEIVEKKGLAEKPVPPKPAAAEPLPEVRARRIEALKQELAEKVRKRKEEEEKKRKIEELRKEIEETEDS